MSAHGSYPQYLPKPGPAHAGQWDNVLDLPEVWEVSPDADPAGSLAYQVRELRESVCAGVSHGAIATRSVSCADRHDYPG